LIYRKIVLTNPRQTSLSFLSWIDIEKSNNEISEKNLGKSFDQNQFLDHLRLITINGDDSIRKNSKRDFYVERISGNAG
jgi:hypothetical protein